MRGIVSILISLMIVPQSKVESWKMKVCLNGTVYSTEEHKCKGGIWFVEPQIISSLCFEGGIWAIYDDWCQQTPLIWTVYPKSKGCLSHHNLKKKILGIVYLGNEKRGGLVATSGRRLFLTNKILNEKTFELIDGNILEVFTWGQNNIRYALEQTKENNLIQTCLIKTRTSFFAIYNFEFEDRHNISIRLGQDLCMDAKFKGVRKQKSPNARFYEIYGSQIDSWKSTCTPKVEEYPFLQEEYLEPEDGDRMTIIQAKIDDQSQRIGKKFYAAKFNQEFPQEIEFAEWKFLKIALKIFKKACPSDMVSETYLNDILLLFQFALYESFNLFPPTVDSNKETRERIWSALERCEANATKLAFKNLDPCLNKVPLMEFKSKNGTTALRLLHIPRQIKINVEKFDLILESMWKLMIFIHYFCAESFNEFSSDLSILQNRWQTLIAPDLIRRWKYPGRSLEMIQLLLMNTNVDKNTQNLDYCVAAAHASSPYKGWLKRPLTKFQFKARNSKENLVWDGHAFCGDANYPAEKLGYLIEDCGIRFSKKNNSISRVLQ